MVSQTKERRTKAKVPVNERALLARVNRKLESDAQEGGDAFVVFRLRGRAAEELGRFVLLPAPSLADVIGHGPTGPLSRVERTNLDLVAYARAAGVLRPWEQLVD